MTKVKLLTLAVVVLLVINVCVVGIVLLGPRPLHGTPRGLPHHGPKDKIIELLHFDDAQATQYEKLIEQHRAAIRAVDGRIRDTKRNLYQTLNQTVPSNADSQVNQLGELQREIELVHYRHFKDIQQLCRPDQRAYFEELTGNLVEFFSHPN